jgi:hypothetical protein
MSSTRSRPSPVVAQVVQEADDGDDVGPRVMFGAGHSFPAGGEAAEPNGGYSRASPAMSCVLVRACGLTANHSGFPLNWLPWAEAIR